jgi:hypothetical protein
MEFLNEHYTDTEIEMRRLADAEAAAYWELEEYLKGRRELELGTFEPLPLFWAPNEGEGSL